MKKLLLSCGCVVAIAALVVWLATGAHRGWTRTEITEMRIDPITEIEYPEHRKGFVAGLDFLGAGLLLSAAFIGVSFLIGKRRKT